MALTLALALLAGCASESGSTTDAAIDQSAPVDDLGAARDAGMDAAVPRCVPGMSVACACVGGASGAQSCSAEGVYGACVCPDASAPTDAATDAWTLDIPVRPLGPRLITPQSISRTTTQRPTFRWVLPEGVTRARVTIARNRALTMDVRTGMATGTSWRPTEPLPFAVWFWRVEGLGDDGGVVWTSPTWEFRAPRRDTAVDSSWGTWRDFNGDGYDDLVIDPSLTVYRGSPEGLILHSELLWNAPEEAEGYRRWGATYVRTTDLNGDGLTDVAYLAFASRVVVQPDGGMDTVGIRRLQIHWGTPKGFREVPDVVLNDYPGDGLEYYEDIAAGDFDGDGYGDILAVVSCAPTFPCEPAGPPRVILYSRLSEAEPQRLEMPIVSPDDFVHGLGESSDLDRDGIRDFVLQNGWTRRDVTSVQIGRSLLAESSVDVFGYAFDLDIDGDGNIDWARGLSNRIELYRWTEAGTMPSGYPAVLSPDTPSGVAGNAFGSRLASGDINGDGYADLVAGAPEAPLRFSTVNSRGDGSVYAFLGSPTGLSMAVATWRGQAHASSSERDGFGDQVAASYDFDGDGFYDIVIVANATERLHVRIELRYGAARAADIGERFITVPTQVQPTVLPE